MTIINTSFVILSCVGIHIILVVLFSAKFMYILFYFKGD